MQCPNCKSKLKQEQTKIWSRLNKDINTKDAYSICDNWHCPNCKSVFTNKELNLKLCQVQ